jgi:hypothetical protein
VLTVVAVALIAAAIALDIRRVIGGPGGSPEAVQVPPGRTVVVSTAALTAEQVLNAVAPTAATRSIMVVAPEGLGSHGLMVNERDYERARRAEADTVAALRRAGINAAGHVGDRDPAHAIEDALALFPAMEVVVVARGEEADLYREHTDFAEVEQHTGAEVRVLEIVAT